MGERQFVFAKRARQIARHLWQRAGSGNRPGVDPHGADYKAIHESALLDGDWYLASNSDVAAAGLDPITHYIQHGGAEGRNPNPFFDGSWYLNRYQDVAAAGLNPLLHYIRHGAAEGRDPSPRFSGDLYLKSNADIARSGGNPLKAYLQRARVKARIAGASSARPSRRPPPLGDIYSESNNWLRARKITASRPRAAKGAPFRKGLSVVILNLNKPDLIIPLVTDLERVRPSFKTSDFEIIIGDTGSTSTEVLAFYDDAPRQVKIIRGLDYQFSKTNNECFFDHAEFDKVLFLNNDIIIKNNISCIAQMAEEFDRSPQQGAVGLCLFYEDGRLQHGGIDFFASGGLKGFCYHPHTREHFDIRARSWAVPAVTGACLMTRSTLFAELGGFDEAYACEAQDVDLCLKISKLGYAISILNCGRILHLENSTRQKGEEHWEDRKLFMRRWSSFVEATLL